MVMVVNCVGEHPTNAAIQIAHHPGRNRRDNSRFIGIIVSTIKKATKIAQLRVDGASPVETALEGVDHLALRRVTSSEASGM